MKSRKQILKAIGVLNCLIPLLSLSLCAQNKRMLLPADYPLWHKSSRINQAQMSPDGKWAYYSISTVKCDSIFVRKIAGDVQYGFAVSSVGIDMSRFQQYGSWNFSANSSWLAISDSDTVTVVHLHSGKRQAFEGNSFVFVNDKERIFVTKKDSLSSTLTLADLPSGKQQVYKNVTAFTVNNIGSAVAIATDSAGFSLARVIDLVSGRAYSLANSNHGRFEDFTWNERRNAVAFVQKPANEILQTANHKVYIGGLASEKVHISAFIPADLLEVKDQKKSRIHKMKLSANGNELFFQMEENKFEQRLLDSAADKVFKPVEIWAANAMVLPPQQNKYNASYWYCRHADGRLEKMTDSVYPLGFLSGDQQRLMVFNKRRYMPQHLYVNRFVDIHLKDRTTGKTTLLAQKIKDQPNEFMCSPSGDFIVYFKDRQWCVLNFATGTEKCITRNMQVEWSDSSRNKTGILPPYGSPGWLKDNRTIILYDRFDIWLVTADGSQQKKITNGAIQNTTFRLTDEKLIPSGPGGADPWFHSKSYDETKGLFIASLEYEKMENGFWWWTKEKGLTKLISKERDLEYLSKPQIDRPLLFIEKDFDLSPRLVLRHRSGKEEVLYQTNPQQDQYYWGKSKVLRYQIPEGKTLSGALIFPANYDPAKKYPMVVEVYETRSKDVHLYIEPCESTSKSNYTLNPTVYSSDGYFVLFPDISYRLNNPGVAATECVTAAVKAAIRQYNIDKDRVGLTGHSFGGYETSFIISQTDMFKTAIAGAGITDLPDFYLGMSYYGTNLTRVEEDQFRMQAPFYGKEFSSNSPMHNIENIHTPLLLYTGGSDGNVDPSQSRRLQIALWRLGKQSTMLVYPGEDHVLMKEDNQKDLAIRMKEWFDYYLKDSVPADWIKNSIGISAN